MYLCVHVHVYAHVKCVCACVCACVRVHVTLCAVPQKMAAALTSSNSTIFWQQVDHLNKSKKPPKMSTSLCRDLLTTIDRQ